MFIHFWHQDVIEIFYMFQIGLFDFAHGQNVSIQTKMKLKDNFIQFTPVKIKKSTFKLYSEGIMEN